MRFFIARFFLPQGAPTGASGGAFAHVENGHALLIHIILNTAGSIGPLAGKTLKSDASLKQVLVLAERERAGFSFALLRR